LGKNFGEVKKMQKRMPYVLGVLIILLLGSSTVFGADSGVCPVYPTGNEAVLNPPQQEEVLTPGEKYSVPRNQVLLEVFGRVG